MPVKKRNENWNDMHFMIHLYETSLYEIVITYEYDDILFTLQSSQTGISPFLLVQLLLFNNEIKSRKTKTSILTLNTCEKNPCDNLMTLKSSRRVKCETASRIDDQLFDDKHPLSAVSAEEFKSATKYLFIVTFFVICEMFGAS